MKKYFAIIMIIIFSSNILAVDNQKWTPINFIKKGTRRLVNLKQKKVYFYRSEKNDFLSSEISNQTIIKIEAVEKKGPKPIKLVVAIDNVAKNYTLLPMKKIEKYWLFKPMTIKITPAKHLIKISTDNRNSYFRIFRKSKKKISLNSFRASKSKRIVFVKNKISNKKMTYFVADKNTPAVYSLDGDDRGITGFARSLLNSQKSAKFDIFVDGKKIEKISFQLKTSGKYILNNNPISKSHKFSIKLSKGTHLVRLQPINSEVLFRLIKNRGN